MLKKTINYVNAFGEEKSVTAFFSLSQEELILFQKRHGGQIDKFDKDDLSIDNVVLSLEVIKDFMRTAYFETDESGDKFDKSDEAKDRFMETIAAATLLEELLTDEKATNEFMAGTVSHIKNSKLQDALKTSGIIS